MSPRVGIAADEVGPVQQDLTRDGRVDFRDFDRFRGSWTSRPGDRSWYGLCDFNVDERIDLWDAASLVEHWLWQADWTLP